MGYTPTPYNETFSTAAALRSTSFAERPLRAPLAAVSPPPGPINFFPNLTYIFIGFYLSVSRFENSWKIRILCPFPQLCFDEHFFAIGVDFCQKARNYVASEQTAFSSGSAGAVGFGNSDILLVRCRLGCRWSAFLLKIILIVHCGQQVLEWFAELWHWLEEYQ